MCFLDDTTKIVAENRQVAALYGIIHARILEGNLEEADEQLEFLTEIQVSF